MENFERLSNEFSLEPATVVSYSKRMILKKCSIQTVVGQVTLGQRHGDMIVQRNECSLLELFVKRKKNKRTRFF